ncbi:unnamed protein product [Cuscuta campestris]|uniref:Uncharacterized protein n=1 Tax=Cuscuta campestris TaxID=132261 RepID=A0A484KIF3_9ASTE|nr:unnamed protein product [Cuscuta campestris]
MPAAVPSTGDADQEADTAIFLVLRRYFRPRIAEGEEQPSVLSLVSADQGSAATRRRLQEFRRHSPLFPPSRAAGRRYQGGVAAASPSQSKVEFIKFRVNRPTGLFGLASGSGSRGGYRWGCRGCSGDDGTVPAGAAGRRIDSLGSIPRRDRGFNPPKVNLLWVSELALL